MQDTDELAALPKELADAIREHRDIRAAWHGEIDDELEARHHASYAKRDQLCRELLIPRALENATQFSGRLLQAVERLFEAVAECDLLGMTSRLKRTLGEIAIECREMTSLLWGPFQDYLPYQELDSCAREFLIIRAEDQLPIADYLNRLNLDIMRAVRGDGEPMLSEIRSLASRLVNEVEVITAKPLESVADSEGESTTDATDSVCINDSSSTDSECEITAEEAAAAVDRCNVLRVPIADDETTSKIIHAGCSQLIDAAVQLQQAIEEYEDAKGAAAGFDDLNTDPDAWESREEFASEWLAPLNAPMTLLWDLMRQIPRPQSTSSGPFPPIITESHNTRTEFRAAYLLRTITANLGKLFTNRGFQPVAVGTFSHDQPIILGWDPMDFDKPLPDLKQFVAPLSRAVQMLTEFKQRDEEQLFSDYSRVDNQTLEPEVQESASQFNEGLQKLYCWCDDFEQMVSKLRNYGPDLAFQLPNQLRHVVEHLSDFWTIHEAAKLNLPLLATSSKSYELWSDLLNASEKAISPIISEDEWARSTGQRVTTQPDFSKDIRRLKLAKAIRADKAFPGLRANLAPLRGSDVERYKTAEKHNPEPHRPRKSGADSIETVADRLQLPKKAKGVSLQDAARIMCDADKMMVKELVRRWQNTRTPSKPNSMGKAPDHRQRKLYAPSALCDWIEEVDGIAETTECQLRKRLTELARPVR